MEARNFQAAQDMMRRCLQKRKFQAGGFGGQWGRISESMAPFGYLPRLLDFGPGQTIGQGQGGEHIEQFVRVGERVWVQHRYPKWNPGKN